MVGAPSDKSNWPRMLVGFSHISRFWDHSHQTCAARILPGEFYVSRHNEVITTVLGSCVSACVRDTTIGVGGMNHFMLPASSKRSNDGWGGKDFLATRYGIAAMESLINEILKNGGRKDRLELKLFGGGKVMAMGINSIGERNIEFAKEFAQTEGLHVTSEDLGDVFPRKVHYFPRTGRAMVRRLRSLQCQSIIDQEKKYERTLDKPQKDSGAIELFD